jgi:hypothetical protein
VESTDCLRELLASGAPEGCAMVTSSGDGPGMWAATVAVGTPEANPVGDGLFVPLLLQEEISSSGGDLRLPGR